MIDRDLIEALIAFGLIATGATVVLVMTSPPRKARPPRPRRRARKGQAPASRPTAVRPVGGRPRPRILTGEPGPLEPTRPAARRALKLIAGITVLAAGGAIGLLALVRAVVAMLD